LQTSFPVLLYPGRCSVTCTGRSLRVKFNLLYLQCYQTHIRLYHILKPKPLKTWHNWQKRMHRYVHLLRDEQLTVNRNTAIAETSRVVLWDVTPCSPVEVRRFGRTHGRRIRRQCNQQDDLTSDYTASHPRNSALSP
jgi:hypothetical protein